MIKKIFKILIGLSILFAVIYGFTTFLMVYVVPSINQFLSK